MPKLKALLADVEQQIESQFQIPRDERDPDLGLLRIVRSAVAVARGMDKLDQPPEEEAAMILFRAIYETLLDMREIVFDQDPARQILKMRAAACMDLARFAEGSDIAAEYARAARDEIEVLRGLNPAAVDEVEAQRSGRGRTGRRWHWSGKTRLQLEEGLPPTYGPLSWMAHGSLGPVLEYRPGILAQTRDAAAVFLLLIWNVFAQSVGAPQLEPGRFGIEEPASS